MTDSWEASFGDLDFSPAAQYGDVEVSVYGLRRGKHTRVTAVADSLIQDGSIERVVRDDNRDVQLVLCLDGSDSEALAQYEATLFREVNKGRNEFRWTPPDGFGATAVFDVLWADLQFADDDTVWDLDEIRGRRNYVLTLRCLPFARSASSVTLDTLTSAASPTSVTVDSGASAAAWSGTNGSAVTSSGGVLSMPMNWSVLDGSAAGDSGERMRRTGSVTMTDTPYLSLEWKQTNGYVRPRMWADGVELSTLATVAVPSVGSGWSRTTWYCPESSVSVVEFRADTTSGHAFSNPNGTVSVDNLVRTNQGPDLGSSIRQKVSTLEIPGSARMPASIAMTATSGSTRLIYTYPDLRMPYAPPMRRYSTATTTGTSTGAMSGNSHVISSGGIVMDCPAYTLPSGPYEMVARVRLNDSTQVPFDGVTYTLTAQLVVDGVPVGAIASTSAHVKNSALSQASWTMISLGSMPLPPSDLASTSSPALVRLTLTPSSTGGRPSLDDLWAFYMPADGSCALSHLTGVLATTWLDAPTVDRPYPAAYHGTDRATAYAVDGSTSNWTEHQIHAGRQNIFTAHSGTQSEATVTVTGSPRWLTHPAN